MPDPLDLTGDIATAIDGAALRGSTLSIAHVREDGSPSVTLRGSLLVHGPQQLGLWARKRDDGLVRAIASEPRVSLVYYSPDTPGPAYLSIEGRARVAPELDDEIYNAMIEGERGQDPERNGVAVIIDVDTVMGGGAGGYFQQAR